MVASSQQRGHSIEFNGIEWVYSDTKESIMNERPCVRCGCLPTPEGYDACTGRLEGVSSACCGHGVKESYTILKEVKRMLDIKWTVNLAEEQGELSEGIVKVEIWTERNFISGCYMTQEEYEDLKSRLEQ